MLRLKKKVRLRLPPLLLSALAALPAEACLLSDLGGSTDCSC
jgi:hypothetical protein